jgi:hypothetical protein
VTQTYTQEMSRSNDWEMRIVNDRIVIELHRRVWTPDLAWCLAENLLSLVRSVDVVADRGGA